MKIKAKIWNKKVFVVATLITLLIYLNHSTFASTKKRITVAAVGDCVITQKISSHSEEKFLEVVELLRKADVAFGNLEGTLHDKKGYPAPKGKDMNLVAEPIMAEELKWVGFDMMGIANNHSLDYMFEGMFDTQANLSRVGIVSAGVGRDLQEASAPAYFETKNGRVALINCATIPIAPPWCLASLSRGDVIGRPGINPLRLLTTFQITEEDMKVLKKIGNEIISPLDGWDVSGEGYPFLGLGKFKVGSERKSITTIDEGDVKRITDSIKRARKNADIVMVAVHNHDQGKYLKVFARICIDAGADCFFGSGPHRLTGLQIYKGKPIFHSLANFIFQYRTVKEIPAEVYESQGYNLDPLKATPVDFYSRALLFDDEVFWISVVPRIVFFDGEVEEIVLYPVTLNFGADEDSSLGRPMMADQETGKRVIDRIIKWSKQYGTDIIYQNGLGIVKVK